VVADALVDGRDAVEDDVIAGCGVGHCEVPTFHGCIRLCNYILSECVGQ
jgi:hypothetical protein